jgi:hypothetical protein
LTHSDYFVGSERCQLAQLHLVAAQRYLAFSFICQRVEAFDQFGKDVTFHKIFSL